MKLTYTELEAAAGVIDILANELASKPEGSYSTQVNYWKDVAVALREIALEVPKTETVAQAVEKGYNTIHTDSK
jgi:hypothetical protein